MSYDDAPHYGSYATSLIKSSSRETRSAKIRLTRDLFVCLVPHLFPESARLRKNQFMREVNLLKALPRLIWTNYLGETRHELE
jgi:hypothetical protein